MGIKTLDFIFLKFKMFGDIKREGGFLREVRFYDKKIKIKGQVDLNNIGQLLHE